MDSFKGKYERVSAENYEEFLKALDVNFLLRKAATVSTPVMEVSEEDGVWTIKTSTTLKTMELKFKVGEEFDETTPDGREVKAIVTLDGNKFVCEQKAKKEGQKSTKSIREFNGDECIYTMTIDGMDLVCVQKFKRV
uniref:Cellular retinoic acid-binding protein 2 n=1 Tax=Acartia pacifica TaxID=335913 RepID=A0A0U2UEZ0_ACAPC|nr:cellular retinoic acid-binding protein 2 [Acartia pacifica]ALS04315.1 cellular retinoic acid-binding protein 2 [Acartia pacifica]